MKRSAVLNRYLLVQYLVAAYRTWVGTRLQLEAAASCQLQLHLR